MSEEFTPLKLSAEDSVSSVKDYLAQIQESFNQRLLDKKPVMEALQWHSHAIDHLMKALYQFSSGNYSIVALGGYGREELCYYSDIDLLILHRESSSKTLKEQVDKILYPLWDSGIDLGYAVRTEKECLQLMKGDLTILTALMDARWITGQQELFEHFSKYFWRRFNKRRFLKNFLKQKSKEQESRTEKYGDTIYLLEPNIKEGKGGLRDIQQIRWMAQAVFHSSSLKTLVDEAWITDTERISIEDAIVFFNGVRNQLHALAQRKTDQILFEHQEPLAKCFDFHNTEKLLAAEGFMQTYYRHAANGYQISQKVMRKADSYVTQPRRFFLPKQPRSIHRHFQRLEGKILLKNPHLFKEQPFYLIGIFRVMQKKRLDLDRSTRDAIIASRDIIDDNFRSDPRMTQMFRAILAEPETVVPPLVAMHELGILERFLPEFRNLMYRAQHDIYHVYTVDTHSILAVGEFGKFLNKNYAKNYPTPTRVAQTVKKKDLLAFAILYHDIGKGEGAGHVKKGAPLIRQAAIRLGYSEKEQNFLEFLELSHLIMPHLSFRRDIDDPNLIKQFAKAMQTKEKLMFLYLLTLCDIKSVSPEALTKWKETLLEHLYLKTDAFLDRGEGNQNHVSETKGNLKEEVELLAGADLDRRLIEQFFAMMPPRYFLTTEPVTILNHIVMYRHFEKDPFVFSHRQLEKESLSEWTIYTVDSAQLFSKLCGVMTANNINIHEVNLNKTTNGHVLHTFKLISSQGAIIDEEERWKTIEQQVRDSLQDKISVPALVAKRLASGLVKPKVIRHLPTKIQIDNDVSPFYTVIDIYTHNRIGLLYQITSTLEELGLYVDISKIATKVDQVTDTFYVRDIFRHKITSQERLKKINERLLQVVDQETMEPTKKQGKAS